MYYHLSLDPNLTVLTPKIPECALAMYEDVSRPRVCFSDFIEGCLSALHDYPRKFYVYVPVNNVELYSPTVSEVLDVKFTHEYWSLKPIEVKCIGIIQSDDYIKTEQHNTGRGRITFFYYPYKWLERFE